MEGIGLGGRSLEDNSPRSMNEPKFPYKKELNEKFMEILLSVISPYQMTTFLVPGFISKAQAHSLSDVN